MMARTLTRDVTLHGRTMEKGRKVALILASANPRRAPLVASDVFDVTRDASEHVGLGYGIHHCMGAALARLEGRVALEEILAVMPDFDVDYAALERVHSGNVRGFSKVPITFTPVR
jgi:cytochrome P450